MSTNSEISVRDVPQSKLVQDLQLPLSCKAALCCKNFRIANAINLMVGLPNEAAATGACNSYRSLTKPTSQPGESWLHLFYQNSILLFFNLYPSLYIKRVLLFLMAHALIIKGEAIAKASPVAARDEAPTYRFFRGGPHLEPRVARNVELVLGD